MHKVINQVANVGHLISLVVRQWLVRWLMRGVHLPEVHFGERSITCSPAGVGDVIRWSASKPAIAAGDIGMDTATGRPAAFVGGVSAPLATSADVTAASSGILGWGNSSISAGADTRFLDAWYNQNTAPLVVTGGLVAPKAGTLKNLAVRHNVANGNGNTVVYTVMKNAVATAITVTLASNAIGQALDTVNTVAVAQGDVISLRAVKAASIANGTQEVTVTLQLV
jgi:hypothetical protein